MKTKRIMNKLLCVILALTLSPLNYTSVFAVTTLSVVKNNDATQLALKLVGDSMPIKNAVIVGKAGQSGIFTDAGVTQIEEGVVLGTGDVANIIGPNKYISKSTSYTNAPGDSQLTLYSGKQTYDAVVLEFEFKPQEENLVFDYIFMSDEYNEYAPSNYNDAFAFFVNGKNAAILPGTSKYVTINNVNLNSSSQYFVDNSKGYNKVIGTANTLYPTTYKNFPYDTEMDGFTTVLTAVAKVNIDQWNKIRIVIADASDRLWDSNVLLKANSFKSVADPTKPNISISPTTWTNTDVKVDVNYFNATNKTAFYNGGWNTYTVPFYVSYNQTIQAQGVNKNESGASSPSAVTSYEVTNIDKDPPNAPTINMNQQWITGERKFTLESNGDGNLLFDGNAYAEFVGNWHDDIFGANHSTWTIEAIITPENLTGITSNHGTKNVFISKASSSDNDNLEIGIDDLTQNLMLYLDTQSLEKVSIIGNGELNAGEQHQIIITYDHGNIIVALDGNEYADYSWSSSAVLDSALNSPLTFGATRDSNTYFDGKINSIGIYSEALTQDDIYNGSVNGLVASYDFKNANNNKLFDKSTNHYDSTSVSSMTVQGELSGVAQLQYKIGDGTWTNYTVGSTITALDFGGEVAVYARALDSAGNVSSLTDRTARVNIKSFVDNIVVTPEKTEANKFEQITVEYLLTGSEIIINNAAINADFIVNNTVIKILVPTQLTVIENQLPANFVYDSNTKIITGQIYDLKMLKISGNNYKLQNKSIVIKYKLDKSDDVIIPENSIDLTYKDVVNNNVNFIGGNGASINVLPNKPTIDTIMGNDIISGNEDESVKISGTADPNQTLTITVTDGDNTKIIISATTDNSGKYSSVGNDLSSLSDGTLTVEAKVEDDDGDIVKTTKNVLKVNKLPDVI